jgi:hypothetical protein
MPATHSRISRVGCDDPPDDTADDGTGPTTARYCVEMLRQGGHDPKIYFSGKEITGGNDRGEGSNNNSGGVVNEFRTAGW